jgi:hypothetical protein
MDFQRTADGYAPHLELQIRRIGLNRYAASGAPAREITVHSDVNL